MLLAVVSPHLGRQRPQGVRPFPATEDRAFHHRAMKESRQKAFAIHSREQPAAPQVTRCPTSPPEPQTVAGSVPPPPRPTPAAPTLLSTTALRNCKSHGVEPPGSQEFKAQGSDEGAASVRGVVPSPLPPRWRDASRGRAGNPRVRPFGRRRRGMRAPT